MSVSPITISSPSLQFKEGKPFSGMVAQVTDTNNNVHVADVSATINWGDGSTSAGRIQRLHQHVFGVFGNHRYSEEGSHQVVVSATIAGVTASNASGFIAANLVADIAALGPTVVDTNLVNGWGLAASPTGPFWVASNGTGVAGVYNSSGQSQLAVTIPTPSGSADTHASPTGVVFNSTSDFAVGGSPSKFLFATEQGTIAGWASGTAAVTAVDNSTTGVVYKGLALGVSGGNNFLYATNFNAGVVNVFDKAFAPATLAGNFTDPNLPSGFAPFGIQNIGGKLYVTYALQDAAKHDDVHGAGNGFVDVFNTDGTFVQRLASMGTLNSPWGVVLAPAGFSQFPGALLVGNFGDGKINAFDPNTGAFLGQLLDASGNPLVVDGLWGLSFGNGGAAGATNQLFYAAGPSGEAHGAFGQLTVSGSPGTAIVHDRHLKAWGREFIAPPNGVFSGRVGAFVDHDKLGTLGEFTVNIDWGDGTQSPGTVTNNGTHFVIDGTHTYTAKGIHDLTITITDAGGITAVTQSRAHVKN